MDSEDDDFIPSRSARKREAEALQRVGEQLVELPSQQLASIPMSDALREAVLTARRLDARGARRRQLQLVGKLMRREEVEPIQVALARLESGSAAAIAEQHRIERWRERLLGEPDALTEFLREHPQADSQQLRQLIRNARAEAAAEKPPKAARELFRLLRSYLQ